VKLFSYNFPLFYLGLLNFVLFYLTNKLNHWFRITYKKKLVCIVWDIENQIEVTALFHEFNTGNLGVSVLLFFK
jgi:hypothetical protein